LPTEVESYVVTITRKSFDWKQIPRGAEACRSRSQHYVANAHRSLLRATHGLLTAASSPRNALVGEGAAR